MFGKLCIVSYKKPQSHMMLCKKNKMLSVEKERKLANRAVSDLQY